MKKLLIFILVFANIGCSISTPTVSKPFKDNSNRDTRMIVSDRPAIIRPVDIVSKKAGYR